MQGSKEKMAAILVIYILKHLGTVLTSKYKKSKKEYIRFTIYFGYFDLCS